MGSGWSTPRPGTHFTGGSVGTRADVDGCGKSCPHRDSIPGMLCPSESLYQLSCPGPPSRTRNTITLRSNQSLLLARNILVYPIFTVLQPWHLLNYTASHCIISRLDTCIPISLSNPRYSKSTHLRNVGSSLSNRMTSHFRQSSTLSRYLETSDAKCQSKLEIRYQHFDVETSSNVCHVNVGCCVECTGQVVRQAASYKYDWLSLTGPTIP